MDYIAESELEGAVVEEWKGMGAKDFCVGGDLNIELKTGDRTERYRRGFALVRVVGERVRKHFVGCSCCVTRAA